MCSLEFPDLQKQLHEPLRDAGLVVLGVSGDGLFGDESRTTLERFVEQTKVTFPILLGDDSRRAYGKPASRISPFPFDVIIDKEGKVRYASARFDAAQLRRVIDELLAE